MALFCLCGLVWRGCYTIDNKHPVGTPAARVTGAVAGVYSNGVYFGVCGLSTRAKGNNSPWAGSLAGFIESFVVVCLQKLVGAFRFVNFVATCVQPFTIATRLQGPIFWGCVFPYGSQGLFPVNDVTSFRSRWVGASFIVT